MSALNVIDNGQVTISNSKFSIFNFQLAIQKGFTLIELMVVISIIGIVFGLIITSSMAVKSSSRDTTRKADLGQIQTALEQYHADQHYYPSSVHSGDTITGTHVYLQTVPTDPSEDATSPYDYTPSPGSCNNISLDKDCLSYVLCAQLESPPSGVTTPIGCSAPYNYSVSSQ